MSERFYHYRELKIDKDDPCEEKIIKLFHNCCSFCYSNPGLLNDQKKFAWVFMILELSNKGIIDVSEEFIDIFIANVYPEFYIDYKEREDGK